MVAGVAEFSTSFLPAWAVASVLASVVLCALPFSRFRLVVPLALVTWGVGWVLYFYLLATATGLLHYFVG